MTINQVLLKNNANKTLGTDLAEDMYHTAMVHQAISKKEDPNP